MHTTRLFKLACATLLLSAGLTALAQSPFIGKWKLDPSQSQLTGDTVKFASDPSGGMSFTSEGHTYNFKTDGQPVKTYSGADVTWKQVDDHTWESDAKRGETDLGTATWTVSPDGKSLSVQRKGTRPDGSSFDNQTSYDRVDGESGLAGSWRSSNTKMAEEVVIESSPTAPMASSG